ncbi:MAG: ubiquinone biosynthesis protein COQ4 [Myxococcota bacterium]|jgi:ubiquinone biosynthesis protein COQ4
MMETHATESLEQEAVRVSLHGSLSEKVRLIVTSVRILGRDPNRTEQIFRFGLVVNLRRFRKMHRRLQEHEEGAWLVANRPPLDSSTVDFEALRALPAGTLGAEYVGFLDDNGLDADFFHAPPDLPEHLTFVLQRLRQTHDVYHALTGYGTDRHGELEVQAFTWAQIRAPASLLILIGGMLSELPGSLRMLPRLWRAYRRGRRATWLFPLRWEQRWGVPLSQLQAELNL